MARIPGSAVALFKLRDVEAISTPDGFFLTKAQMVWLAPRLPNDTRSALRVDDRRITGGIVHVLRSGSGAAPNPTRQAAHPSPLCRLDGAAAACDRRRAVYWLGRFECWCTPSASPLRAWASPARASGLANTTKGSRSDHSTFASNPRINADLHAGDQRDITHGAGDAGRGGACGPERGEATGLPLP